MTSQPATQTQRQAAIEKVTWFDMPDGRRAFRGHLAGKPRCMVARGRAAEDIVELVDMAVEMDAGRA